MYCYFRENVHNLVDARCDHPSLTPSSRKAREKIPSFVPACDIFSPSLLPSGIIMLQWSCVVCYKNTYNTRLSHGKLSSRLVHKATDTRLLNVVLTVQKGQQLLRQGLSISVSATFYVNSLLPCFLSPELTSSTMSFNPIQQLHQKT